MGIIILIGIVVNNGIVLVDRMNQLRRGGRDAYAAAREAGRERLRPILMTTATTVLGLLPMALGLGEGAELRAPLAVTVIGGLLLATGLTLVAVPVLYTLMTIRRQPATVTAPAGGAGVPANALPGEPEVGPWN
jgi:HAE1 family hydrophobic/amphiphilic exporter-1